MFAGCGKKDAEADNTLYVYCFGDYFDPELQYEFEEQTGYKVVVDLFDTNEEMYPVIKNNSADYDVICASDYMIERLRSEDLLSEINFDNIPNVENIADNIKPFMEEFDPGIKYSAPHTWEPTASCTTRPWWTILWTHGKYSGTKSMPTR